MAKIVKVASKGHVTIPAEFRREFGLKEGNLLLVEATKEGMLFKPISKLVEMAGTLAAYGTPEEIKKEIDKLREEY